MPVHTIRLRAPWHCLTEGETTIWRRLFGCPTGLGHSDRVRLVVEPSNAATRVDLNGRLLPPLSQGAGFLVTGALLARNEVVLYMKSTAATETCPAEPPCQVRLEIETSD